MNTIFLVRHGQDTDNANLVLNGHRDTELTLLGRQQAEAVGEKLKGRGIGVIYSSPLKRTSETAQIIAGALNLPTVLFDDRLVERDFGILTGKRVAEIPTYASSVMESDRVTYFLEAEGAESFPVLYQRGKDFLEFIAQQNSGFNILVVTSGDIGKMIRAVYRGWGWEQGLKTPYFDNTDVLELSKE